MCLKRWDCSRVWNLKCPDWGPGNKRRSETGWEGSWSKRDLLMTSVRKRRRRSLHSGSRRQGKQSFLLESVKLWFQGCRQMRRQTKRRHSEQFMSMKQSFKTTHAANSCFWVATNNGVSRQCGISGVPLQGTGLWCSPTGCAMGNGHCRLVVFFLLLWILHPGGLSSSLRGCAGVFAF